MTVATMMKRINTQRATALKYEKKIRYYEKEYCAAGNPEHMIEEGRRWVNYYNKQLAKAEETISKMSKQAAAMATEEQRSEMVKAMAADMEKRGITKTGYTTNGLRYWIHMNHGITERSRHCYTMDIEGRGTVFTSGTLETVAEYILNN